MQNSSGRKSSNFPIAIKPRTCHERRRGLRANEQIRVVGPPLHLRRWRCPIVGPAVAIIWGWLPAFLWVTLGTIFIAGMHDMGILWASQRHRGQSIGTLSGRYIGKRGRNLFLVVIFLLLLMVVAAFAVVISNLLIANPSAVIPTWGAIVVALLIGQAVYRMQWNLPVVSILGVIALYTLVLIGDRFLSHSQKLSGASQPTACGSSCCSSTPPSPHCCRCGSCYSHATTSTACNCLSPWAFSTAPCCSPHRPSSHRS